MLIKPDPQLNLDPGSGPRRRSISGCRCLVITAAIVLLSAVVLFFTRIVTNVVTNVSKPHRALYQNASLQEVSNRASVVQPLINRNQKFDIAATVWLRSAGSRNHELPVGGGAEDGETTEAQTEVFETPLYSDIVFRGLRLTDKDVFSAVNFTLPTDTFRSPNLTNFDLRASIMLLPSSTSLLDHVTNYSTWIPEKIHPLPVRSWPFPLGSRNQLEKTLADEALESFGVTTPLLQFHSVHSRCYSADKESHDAVDEQSYSDDDDDDDDESESDNNTNIGAMAGLPSLQKTCGKSVLKYHPYIVTRTLIHVVHETELFNRKAYVKAQKNLMGKACAQGISGVYPNRYSCQRNYFVNGHWETLLKVAIRNESTGKVQTEWAYAPYISVSRSPPGPKDLFQIPVNRENCSTILKPAETNKTLSNVAPEQDFVNVTWKISYSGRTPGKHIVSDVLSYKFDDHNQTERDRILGQDVAELTHGLYGHRFSEDAHPRRRAVLYTIEFALSTSVLILDIRYWYTRTSTVSISILGTALISGSELFVKLGSFLVNEKRKGFSIFGFISSLVLTMFTSLVLPLLMIQAILRIEFRKWKGTMWIPIMQRAGATHRERASERLEAATSWRAKAGLFLSIAAMYYVFTPHEAYIIPSLLPDLDHTDDWLTSVNPLIVNPLHLTGTILQLYLNSKSQFFAGRFKFSIFLMLIVEGGRLVEFTPSLIGRFDARPGLLAHDIVQPILLFMAAWQALTLPNVPQISDDEHVE